MSIPFLLDEIELSNWAYNYCKNIKDDKEIRELITESIDSFKYCKYVCNDPEISRRIVTLSYFE